MNFLMDGKIEGWPIIMRLVVLTRVICIFFILLLIAVSNVITYKYAGNRNKNIEVNDILDYSVYFGVSHSTNTEKYMLVPVVAGINDADRIKINATLIDVFVNWLPEKFKYPEPTSLNVTLSTNKFLSAYINYTFLGRLTENMTICNTIDIQTGNVMYLNDLIEVDEEFAKLILTDGILKLEYNWMTDEYDVNYPGLNEKDANDILKELTVCSEPFNQDNWSFKPTFYLQKNRLYLLNIFNHESKCYIELDKIEDKLKVHKW